MRLILTTLTLFFIIAIAKAQAPVFTFECFKNANMTGDSCDICTGTIYEARSFNGLMVYRLGVFNKWIDEPYLIRVRPGESVEFIEQIGGSNPDKITIPLSQTGFSTLKGFVDSTFCEGASFDFAFSISDSLRTTEVNPFDTISIVGRGGTTVTLDTVTHKYVIESATGGGGGATNLTYSGTSSPVTLNSSTGSDVTIAAGAGIGLAATSTDLTITATDPSITNETNTAFGVASGALFISDPNSTFNVPVTTIAPDQSATNELQNLSLAGQALGITSGTGVNLPIVGVNAGTGIGVGIASGIATVSNTGDLSNTNELNTAFAVVGSNLSLSDANGTLSVSVSQIAPDQSITNEAQTLTSGTNSVTLSNVSGVGGGTVTVDTDPTDDITGSGTTNFVPKFTASKTLGNSQIFDNGTNVGVKTTSPTYDFSVNGVSSATRFITDEVGSHTYYESRRGGVRDFQMDNIGGDFWYYNGTSYSFFIQKTTGNVGINTGGAASRPLHVAGIARITGSGGQATSITGRDANNDITNVTLGTNLSLSGGVLNASAPTNTWLIGGNTLAGTSTIGSNSNHAVEIETNGTTKVHVATSGRVGVGTNLPRADMDVRGTIGIQMPSGATAQRPTVLAPTIRHNTTASALEYADQGSGTDTIWYRLTSKVAPTASWNGNVIGSSANGASVTFAAGSNHLCGTVIIQTATTISGSGANATAVTVSFSPTFGPAGRPFAVVCPANQAAAATNLFYLNSALTTNSGITLGVTNTVPTNTQFQFNYIIRQ